MNTLAQSSQSLTARSLSRLSLKRVSRAGLWLTLGSCLTACGREGVDLGGGSISQTLARGERCAASTALEEDVVVSGQQDLDALAGCEEIRGNLIVRIFPGADLTPLSSLRVVEGQFALGVEQDWDSILGFLISDRLDTELELIRAGWVASLDGLQALERVGALFLRGLPDADLTALSSLRSVGGNLAGGFRGQVFLQQNQNLHDLAGLEGVAEIRGLVITLSPELVSLNGLDASLLQAVSLYTSPKLSEIGVFAPLTGLDSLTLFEIGVRDLDAFSELQSVSTALYVSGNPALVDASGLGGLLAAEQVAFLDNPELVTLPSFVQFVTQPSTISIQNNSKLGSVVLDFANALTTTYNIGGFPAEEVDDAPFELGMDVIDIRNNASLQSIAIPAGLTKALLVLNTDNPSLTSIDLGSLRELGQLSIDANDVLATVDTGALERVDVLQIRDNPRLSPAVFDAVQTFSREISGNAE
jgi:hypothetical protein